MNDDYLEMEEKPRFHDAEIDSELFTAEKEFLVSCLFLDDLLYSKIINKKEYIKARQKLNLRKNHIYRCLEVPGQSGLVLGGTRSVVIRGKGYEQTEQDQDKSFKYSVWPSKVVCGVCGDYFCHRVITRPEYTDHIWACKGRAGSKNKGHRCSNFYLYDNQLTMILLSTVKNLIWKYNAVTNCVDALNVNDIRKHWKIISHEMTSVNESDVACLIKWIKIYQHGVAEIIFLDESIDRVLIEDYSPRKYRKKLQPERGKGRE